MPVRTLHNNEQNILRYSKKKSNSPQKAKDKQFIITEFQYYLLANNIVSSKSPMNCVECAVCSVTSSKATLCGSELRRSGILDDSKHVVGKIGHVLRLRIAGNYRSLIDNRYSFTENARVDKTSGE